MANHCAFSFNHDYFNPTDSRSIVSEAIRPIVDRQSADILPNFGSFFCRPMLSICNYPVMIFSSADNFGALVIGLASVDRRPISHEK